METVKLDPQIVPLLLKLHHPSIWIDLDEEADTLYISFEKPQRADDSVMEDDGHIYHYRGEKMVGITVLNAHRGS
ncbi:DUF2283 domain-containing protein [Deltaproteobacteria bacterium TL4]